MSQSRTGLRRIALPAAYIAVASSALAVLSSGAVFTDSSSVPGNAFTAGTVSISATPTTVAWDAGNLAPGDVKYATLNVKNDGTLAQRYSLSLTATNTDGKNLANRLTVGVVAGAATCDAAGFAAAGTPLYNGVMGTATKVLGDKAQGAHAGDRVLPAAANENLCFKVTFPNGTAAVDNPYQGATTTAAFTFDAEQTTNN